ncbi:MAG: hypothetical protein H8D87_17405 [Deltaproteobacteria bacterium]|nr:hypothetical protein [Candidatus Desulfobacula maris]
MKQTVIFLILLFVFPVMAFAASPMVEKHIFLPEKASEKKKILSDDKIKESISFTGVVISEKGRYALINEKVKKKGEETQKKIYEEGEEISGAIISKIEPNYIVLLNSGKEIKIKLYSGAKKRPAPPAVQAPPPVETTASTQETGSQASQPAGIKTTAGQKGSDPSQKTSPTLDQQIKQNEQAKGNVPSTASNPFAEALKKAMENKKSTSSGSSNPFLEAIKRAKNK